MKEKTEQYKNIFQAPHMLFEQFSECCQVNYNLEGFTKTQILNFYIRKLVEEAGEVLGAFNRLDKKAYPNEDPIKVMEKIEEELADVIISWVFAVFACGVKPHRIFEIAIRKLVKKNMERSKIMHPLLAQYLTVK